MGAKLAQVLSIKFPSRINAVVALDGAPIQQADAKFHPYYSLFYNVIQFMNVLADIKDKNGLSQEIAKEMVTMEYKNDKKTAAMIIE